MYPGAVYILPTCTYSNHLLPSTYQHKIWSDQLFSWLLCSTKKKKVSFTERSVNASLDMEQKIKAFHQLFLSRYTEFLNIRRWYNLCYCIEKNLLPSGNLINFRSLMFFPNPHPWILSPICHFLALWKQSAASNRKDHSRI